MVPAAFSILAVVSVLANVASATWYGGYSPPPPPTYAPPINPEQFVHPNGTVEQSALTAAGSVDCGLQWQSCCGNGQCSQTSLACVGGQCQPCGTFVWSACCAGRCPATIQGTEVMCYDNQCQPCGGAWQYPCLGGCKSGFVKNDQTSHCQPCNGQWQPPCGPPGPHPGPSPSPSPRASPTPSPRASPSPSPRASPSPSPRASPSPSPRASPSPSPKPSPRPNPSPSPCRSPPNPVTIQSGPPPPSPSLRSGAPSGQVTMNPDGTTNFRPSAAGSKYWPYPMNVAHGMSLFFYEAQHSGVLPPDNRVLWRGNSPPPQFDQPFSGGWYDAGDGVKFNYPGFSSAAIMAMGAWKYATTLDATQFDGASNLYWTLRETAWVMEYILECHVSDHELVAQVGDGNLDHSYLGRAEYMNLPRPVYMVSDSVPGPDLVMAAAAALANGYIALKTWDPTLAQKCLTHAETLYAWGIATVHQPVYSSSISAAQPFYASTGVYHQVLFAAASLAHATGGSQYISDAKKYGVAPEPGAFGPYKSYSDWVSWDNVWFEGAALMLDLGVDPGTAVGFAAQTQRLVNDYIQGNTGGIQTSPKGQRWLSQWGSSRYALNGAAIALMAAPHLSSQFSTTAKCFGISQLHYVWGESGRSLVVGFGSNPPVQPHHRNAACTLAEHAQCAALFNVDRPDPQTLHGAVVGGPGAPNDVYVDNRADYTTCEVAVDYNALYTVATAAAMALGDGFWSQYPAICEGSVPGVTFK